MPNHFPLVDPSKISAMSITANTLIAVDPDVFQEVIEAQQQDGRALRYNKGKAKLSYTPGALMEGASRALVYGAQKYERNNWRKGFPKTEVMDCLLRHAFAWLEGEDCDAESGLHHFDHVAANIAFLLHMQKTGTGTDDRAIA